MRLAELLKEMPYLHPPEARLPDKEWITYSPEALTREYSLLGVIEDIRVLMHRDQSHLIGITSVSDDSGRFPAIFRLHFKDHHRIKFDLPVSEILQVNLAEIKTGWANTGVMSQVYEMIVGLGVTLVSDDTQLVPGRALWVKLAQTGRYPIYVADVENGLFRNGDGEPVVYNGQNIPEGDIWTGGSDFNGEYRVLIMTPSPLS